MEIFAARILLTFNDSFTIFSIESVDINKIMVVFHHLQKIISAPKDSKWSQKLELQMEGYIQGF
jgi:hypothetical protein